MERERKNDFKLQAEFVSVFDKGIDVTAFHYLATALAGISTCLRRVEESQAFGNLEGLYEGL